MDETPNLRLPYIMAAQSQKHVTHNEAIRAIDALVQLSVLDRSLNTPPDSPADGARYIIGSSPTGAWSGNARKVAAFQDGAWMIYAPAEGWIAWVADEDVAVVWDGTAWNVLSTGEGGGGELDPDAEFDTVAINGATADTTNRLSINALATLLNHDGNGHQLKINKNTAGDTASLLYQTGFSGRAEMGLTGDDDYHFKVSADGATWNEAIVIDKTTGEVSFPNTSIGGGGGGGAPTDAEYIVKSSNGTLSAERVLTDTATVAWDYATGGQAKANVPNDAITYAKLQNVSATDRLLGRASSGAGDAEEITCTSFARSVLDDADAATARATLGLTIGTNVQAYSANLGTFSGIAPASNVQSLLGAANYAAMRGLLDLEAGTDFYSISAANAAFQPLDSDLTSWAGVTRASGFDTFAGTPSSANLRALLSDEAGTGSAYFVGGALGTPASGTLSGCSGLPVSTGVSGLGTGVATALAVNVGSTGAVVAQNGALGTPSSGTLTNCGSLPVSGITASTATALGVGSLELGHASDTTLSRSAAGRLAVEGKNALLLGQTDTLTAGYAATPYSGGTQTTGTFTPNEANGNKQYITANGAFTLGVPSNPCNIELEITNGASAGAITTSSYTKVTGSFTTTNAHKFICYITKTQNYSLLNIVALQ